MATVILLCGKICSGKTTYAHQLLEKTPAVLLSSDQAVLKLFGMYLGDEHEKITARVEQYLLELSRDILNAGMNVILDWGFWTAAERDAINSYYGSHGIVPEWHYIECSQDQWDQNIRCRNAEVSQGTNEAFFIDHNIAEKCLAAFEVPTRDEMDRWFSWDKSLNSP